MNDSKVKSSEENATKRTKRRSLSSIQPISTDNKLLTRTMATTKRSDKDKVKKDNEKITDWLKPKDSDIESDLNYWKTLAKERQKALEGVLLENQELIMDKLGLFEQIGELKHENELLTEENKHLSRLAEEGIKLKNLLEDCLHE